jgi:transcriptional regulator with GAF, ATPase, and Fis domain
LTENRKRKLDKIFILYQENYIVANASLDEKAESFQFSRTVAKDVMKSNKSFLSMDITGETKYKKTESLKRIDTRSLLCVPLRFLGKCIGAIYVDSMEMDGFSVRDVEFMEDFSWILSPYIYSIWEFSEKTLREGEEDVRIIGESPVLSAVVKSVDKTAPSDSSILLEGEKGTGKELIARFVHSRGKRKRGPFVCVECAAVPSNRLESELFGHERGAFTGAYGRKLGKFEMAYGGTLFLDEVSALDSVLQMKLLRVFEEKRVFRVGGMKAIPVDVRIIAGTNRNLKIEVEEGRFRKDLYSRLKGVPIQLPPLRERRGDIPLLVEHFAEMFGKKSGKTIRVSPEVIVPLERYPWYGNVRELKNVIERMVLQTEGETLQFFNLPYEIRSFSGEDKTLSQTVRIKRPAKEEEPVKISTTWEAIQGKSIERTEKGSKDKTE